MRGRHGRFRGPLGGFDVANFLGCLDDAPLVKRLPLRLNPVTQSLKTDGMAEGKITWHQQLRDPGIMQHHMDDVHTPWFGYTLGFDTSFNFRIRQHPIDGGLAFGPVHFEIAHHQNPFTLDLKINERVRSNELGRVIEVRICFAGSDEDRGARRLRCSFRHMLLNRNLTRGLKSVKERMETVPAWVDLLSPLSCPRLVS